MGLSASEVAQRQGLPLEAKVALSQSRIREWHDHWEGEVYIAVSGKDSRVVLDLVRRIYPGVPAVYVDTGLEHPSVREFWRGRENVEVVRPRKSFAQVVREYGYPVVSKEQAGYLYDARHTRSEKLRQIRLGGKGGKGRTGKIFNRWQHLVDAPFEISDKCCDWLKKKPSHDYEKRTGRHPILGTMAMESRLRLQKYMREGCNAFSRGTPVSQPIAFWTDDDIWAYIRGRELDYPACYDQGYTRTGCMFCMFGIHNEPEPNRFQRMAVSHPKMWDYCVNELGCGKVLAYMGIPYAPQEHYPVGGAAKQLDIIES